MKTDGLEALLTSSNSSFEYPAKPNPMMAFQGNPRIRNQAAEAVTTYLEAAVDPTADDLKRAVEMKLAGSGWDSAPTLPDAAWYMLSRLNHIQGRSIVMSFPLDSKVNFSDLLVKERLRATLDWYETKASTSDEAAFAGDLSKLIGTWDELREGNQEALALYGKLIESKPSEPHMKAVIKDVSQLYLNDGEAYPVLPRWLIEERNMKESTYLFGEASKIREILQSISAGRPIPG